MRDNFVWSLREAFHTLLANDSSSALCHKRVVLSSERAGPIQYGLDVLITHFTLNICIKQTKAFPYQLIVMTDISKYETTQKDAEMTQNNFDRTELRKRNVLIESDSCGKSYLLAHLVALTCEFLLDIG